MTDQLIISCLLLPVLPPVVAQGGGVCIPGDVVPGEDLQPLKLCPGLLWRREECVETLKELLF